ncbi:MAG: glucose-1-phosphate thymidylyltransferase [Streptosporangiaceae bacterium]|nr:glucose-1-phosphate thymidylyltransferase [Streptosporangiaceae bacterium]
MKALVLSGGSGSRMRPFSHTSAKQMIPVANKPVLFYALESIAGADIKEVAIVVGDAAAEIRHAIGDGSQFGLAVDYIHQERPLGLAHAVAVARDWLGDEDFLMYLGDNFLEDGIRAPVERFREQRPSAQVLLTRVPDPSSYGIAYVDDATGRITRLAEKPAHPASDMAVVGVYCFSPEIHQAVRRLTPSARGELEITDAIQLLIDDGATVRSETISSFWRDVGTVTGALEVNRAVLDRIASRFDGHIDHASDVSGPVIVEAGARVASSTVIGPAIIGQGSHVVDSVVGPYASIADKCDISSSIIDTSIVLSGTIIADVTRIAGSFIGRDVTLVSAGMSRAHRLVLGDHSWADLPA